MDRLALVASLFACACAAKSPVADAPLDARSVAAFPADLSLMRPEDGVILDDGRIVVADQAHGLRAVNADGSSTPYARFAEAGFVHAPGVAPAGPNGVAFTPDRAHILVADIYTGAIWRVSVADENVEKIYQHEYGVNSAIADASGAIWFTQSAANARGAGSEAAMYDALDKSRAEGKLFRLSTDGTAQLAADGFYYANGLAIDAQRGRLYLAETMADRIVSFSIAQSTGALSDKRVLASVVSPDNVKLGRGGAVYVASPALNALMVVDPETGASRPYFRAGGPDNEAALETWRAGKASGAGVLAAVTPKMWAPLPGAVTSVILDRSGEPAYLGTLGPALARFTTTAQ